MDTQEKNAQVQETNDEQAKPVKPAKRILTAAALRHSSGIAVQTGVRAGQRWPGPSAASVDYELF